MEFSRKVHDYPYIILQFITLNELYEFELVTWWQRSWNPKDVEIKREPANPTSHQIDEIHDKKESIIINKFNK